MGTLVYLSLVFLVIDLSWCWISH